MQVKGSELQIGDVVEVWWRPGRDTITGFRSLTKVIFEGYRRSAQFAQLQGGMTVPDDALFEVVNRND